MSTATVSTIALLLCLAPGVLHSVEVVSPMLSRWIVNYVLPLFGPGLPKSSAMITYDDQLELLDAGAAAVDSDKARATKDYIFLMLFEQRQGSLAFISLAVGAIYALTLPLLDRNPIHLVFGVMSVLFALVNANHAGIRFLGNHPRVSTDGRNVGIVFAPFWAVAAVLNWMAFFGSLPT